MFWGGKEINEEVVDVLGWKEGTTVSFSDNDDIEQIIRSLQALTKEYKLIKSKLDLILKELGKEYVPESSKTEPAKLVNTRILIDPDWADAIAWPCSIGLAGPDLAAETKPKKKRGRPKKKK